MEVIYFFTSPQAPVPSLYVLPLSVSQWDAPGLRVRAKAHVSPQHLYKGPPGRGEGDTLYWTLPQLWEHLQGECCMSMLTFFLPITWYFCPEHLKLITGVVKYVFRCDCISCIFCLCDQMEEVGLFGNSLPEVLYILKGESIPSLWISLDYGYLV